MHNATQSSFAHKLMSIGRGTQPIEHHHQEEEARVCELGGMGEGEVLFFVPSSIGSCWFVARCLVGLSCLVPRVCELHIFISWVCKLEFEIISLSFCERAREIGLDWKRDGRRYS